MRIAIFTALPQEYRTFLKLTKNWQRIARTPFPIYHRQTAQHACLLIETGMGSKRLKAALEAALQMGSLDLVVSAGFAGGLCSSLNVGQVVFGNAFAQWSPPPATQLAKRFFLAPSPELDRFCRRQQVLPVQLLSVEHPHAKRELTSAVSGIPSAVDMETTFLAALADQKGIPLWGLRAISDALDDEIGFNPDDLCDGQGRVRVPKVLAVSLKDPAVLQSFYRSWRRARCAAHQLARALAAFLNLSHASLSTLVHDSPVVKATIEKGRRL